MLFDFWRHVFHLNPLASRHNPPPLVSNENGPSGGQRLEPFLHRMRHGGMPHPAVTINEHRLHPFQGANSLGGRAHRLFAGPARILEYGRPNWWPFRHPSCGAREMFRWPSNLCSHTRRAMSEPRLRKLGI